MDIIETLKMYEDQGYLDKETIHGAIMESVKKYPTKMLLLILREHIHIGS